MTKPFSVGQVATEEAILRLILDRGGSADADLIREIIATTLKLVEDKTDRGDLKIINSALKEMLSIGGRIVAPQGLLERRHRRLPELHQPSYRLLPNRVVLVREIPDSVGDFVGPGVDPGPTKSVRGWHGRALTYNRAFVDSHAEQQKIYVEGTEDKYGYAFHYRNEELESYPDWPACSDNEQATPGSGDRYRCIIVRGPGWQKDTLPAELICTGLQWGGGGRPSYETCVFRAE